MTCKCSSEKLSKTNPQYSEASSKSEASKNSDKKSMK